MKQILSLALLLLYVGSIICPPVQVKKEEEKKVEPDVQADEDVDFGLEYERYLKEVVTVLETDEEFKKKLEESNITDIKSGDIARHLELVSHNIRTKLDELKRTELDRLRQIQRINMKRQQGIPLKDIPDVARLLAHLDHSNPHTFEVDDLSKLLKQASNDLEKLDEARKKEFKTYEMEKEMLHKTQLDGMDEDHRKEAEQKWDDQKQKHKAHPKLHHPGSKDQLEEVWEETDGLSKDDFDPKTFFMLHDTNGDGVLDPVEVEALFQKELDKIYDPNAPEDDMMERYEEMNRMREHVMKEVDKNGDSYISLQEFMDSTKNEDFEKDKGWEGLDEQQVYSDDEYAQFEREYNELKTKQGYNVGEIPIGDPVPSYIPPADGQQPPNVPQPVQHGQGLDVNQQPEVEHQEQQQQDTFQNNQNIPEAVPQNVDPNLNVQQQQQQQPIENEPVPHHNIEQQQQHHVEPQQQQHHVEPQQQQHHVENIPVPQENLNNQVPPQNIDNQVNPPSPNNEAPQQKPADVPQQNLNEVPQQNLNEVPQQNLNEVPQQNVNEVPQQNENKVQMDQGNQQAQQENIQPVL